MSYLSVPLKENLDRDAGASSLFIFFLYPPHFYKYSTAMVRIHSQQNNVKDMRIKMTHFGPDVNLIPHTPLIISSGGFPSHLSDDALLRFLEIMHLKNTYFAH